MSTSDHSNLTIKAFCQSCGAEHAFDPAAVGRRARCGSCGFVFRVPDLKHADEGEAQAAAPASGLPAGAATVDGPAADEPFDPLTELATAEEVAADSDRESVAERLVEALDVADESPVEVRATVTAVTIMLGLFYVALLASGIILLEALVGMVVAIWILLPLVVVYGRMTLTHISFLLTGKASHSS